MSNSGQVFEYSIRKDKYIVGSQGVVQLGGLHRSCDGGPTKV